MTLEYSHASAKGRSGSGKARKKKRSGGASGSSTGASGGGGGSGMMAAARNGDDLSDDERNPADDVSVSDSDSSVGRVSPSSGGLPPSSVGSAGSESDTDGRAGLACRCSPWRPPPRFPIGERLGFRHGRTSWCSRRYQSRRRWRACAGRRRARRRRRPWMPNGEPNG